MSLGVMVGMFGWFGGRGRRMGRPGSLGMQERMDWREAGGSGKWEVEKWMVMVALKEPMKG